jgi:hypothetical protein
MSVSQTPEELRNHLKQQMGFLVRSADSYDNGFADEAKRLAVTIRVLVHDTPKTRCLLGQLDELNRDFLDTAAPDIEGNLMPYGALIQMAMSTSGAIYLPLLDNPQPASASKKVPFREWWERNIFRNKEGEVLSRKQMILSVANQDGGAHIDPSLNEAYAHLSRGSGMGWYFQSEEETHYLIRPPELAAVRQIAHEMLKSLDSTYERNLSVPAGAILIASPSLIDVTPEKSLKPHTATGSSSTFPKVGRNDQCPCGSGKKYKRCHGY